MSTRMPGKIGGAGALAKVRAHEAADLPAACPVNGSRGPAPRRAGPHVPRSGHGRGARGGREAAAARPVALPAAVGRREPALLQLVRPAGSEGPQRLPHVRPPHGRAPSLRPTMRAARPALGLLIAGTLAVAGCGGN